MSLSAGNGPPHRFAVTRGALDRQTNATSAPARRHYTHFKPVHDNQCVVSIELDFRRVTVYDIVILKA